MCTPSLTRPVDLNQLALPDLYLELSRSGLVRRLVELARDEDMGDRGDVTSLVAVSPHTSAQARIASRSPGVVAGLEVVPEILRVFGVSVAFLPELSDGDRLQSGAILGGLSGNLRDILTIERTILNFLGRLSGVASRTAEFVSAIGGGTPAALYDTRKTTPGLRALEKYAVRCGGGRCHRVGLFDAVLIKDNHIAAVSDGDLGAHAAASARAARARFPGQLRFVEIEVDRIEQLGSILAAQRTAPPSDRVDLVLLDNMPPSELVRCVALRDRTAPEVKLEASGGVSLRTVGEVGRSGVDRVSTGSLTHSAVWLDVGLDIAASA